MKNKEIQMIRRLDLDYKIRKLEDSKIVYLIPNHLTTYQPNHLTTYQPTNLLWLKAKSQRLKAKINQLTKFVLRSPLSVFRNKSRNTIHGSRDTDYLSLINQLTNHQLTN
jgi:hypothetical protein